MLEPGCGDGGNPCRWRWPSRRALHGIDAAEGAIARGCALVEALGLTNVTLEVGEIEELELASEAFDYVIHGVYSWVGAAVRDRFARAMLGAVGAWDRVRQATCCRVAAYPAR